MQESQVIEMKDLDNKNLSPPNNAIPAAVIVEKDLPINHLHVNIQHSLLEQHATVPTLPQVPSTNSHVEKNDQSQQPPAQQQSQQQLHPHEQVQQQQQPTPSLPINISSIAVSSQLAIQNQGDDEESTMFVRVSKQIIYALGTCKNCIHTAFDQPNSSLLAKFLSIFIIMNIILSVVIIVTVTLPQFYGQDRILFYYIEFYFTALFTIELILRLIVSPNPIKFCFGEFFLY